ncbi:adenylate/guanylate cyclase domain-containing protein [Rhizobium sp. 16-449-1b]|uniref:adenylate/guanylate cyclase domain-containing protein n=1 Tax=Rhizobium sp. 16-449-1b TaxID=2819989 RepID=UPI001ADC58D0|nr:adenylate/guanylate cyclase domain-containing protein [Rhizobium sp. 16-449-1b]MBO9195386.1 adenylate/guanylate cyclase domain-containing protein [Rhizobium sp. 16-449-1b]
MDSPFDRTGLRQLVDSNVVSAFERAVRAAPDVRLNRMNPLKFAAEHALDLTETISGFLHATQRGIFELSWNVVCSTCGGVLHSAASLRDVSCETYSCALCVSDCEPNLDETVEVTFTVGARIREIGAHHPDRLPLWQYTRECFWSSGSDLPDNLEPFAENAALAAFEVPSGSSVECILELHEGTAVLFDPVTHSSRFLEVEGSATAAMQEVAFAVHGGRGVFETVRVMPGTVKLYVQNPTSKRILPILWKVGPTLKEMVSRRVPVLTANRLMSSQSFRDLYGSSLLDVNQHFKITKLTFLFIDLRESTQLYGRVGDLAAYDFVRAYFHVMGQVVESEGGAVVKTIGDAVMATFPDPLQAIRSAVAMKKALRELSVARGDREQSARIGIHCGPCLAVVMNDRQDYFGQTINMASRLQGIASDRILATEAVMEDDDVRAYIDECGLVTEISTEKLRGIESQQPVFAIRA